MPIDADRFRWKPRVALSSFRRLLDISLPSIRNAEPEKSLFVENPLERNYALEMKTWLLLIGIFFLGLTRADAQEFLSESALLQKHQLSLIPLEKKGPQDFFLLVEPETNAPLSLVESTGDTIPLEKFGATKEKTKTESCGDLLQSFVFRSKEPSESLFALVGKRPPSLKIQWVAFAKNEKLTLSCKSPRKDYKLSSSEIRVDPQGKSYFFAEWDSPEKRKFLDLEKKLGEKVYDQHSPDCRQKQYSIQWVGTQDRSTCHAILKASVDCDGMGYKKGSFGTPLGKIVIQEKGKMEEWIIFEASGYEGDAFLGILKGSKKPKVDFYVYSGC